MGLVLGIIPAMLLIGAIAGTSSAEAETIYTAEIVPNADGSRKTLSKESPVILKLNIIGPIGVEGLTMHSVRTQLTESREGAFKDNRVKAILLHIESPGGTVVDADGIYRALKSYKEQYKVPVYAYVDGMCASGGMYIAAAADKIYASDISLVGSIGVISPPFFNVANILTKYGVSSLTLSAGKGKDEMNPFREWKPDEQETYQGILDYYYNHFIHVMTSNRTELDKTKLINDFGAKVFPAEIAKEHGYIDGSGYSLDATIKLLAHTIGIEDNYYQVVQLEKKIWYNELFGSNFKVFNGTVKHQIDLTPDLDAKLMNQFLYLYRPGM